MLFARVCACMYICLSSPSSQSRITIPGMCVDDHRMKGGPGHAQTNQLHVHDINWGCTRPCILHTPINVVQLLCVYVHVHVRACVCVCVCSWLLYLTDNSVARCLCLLVHYRFCYFCDILWPSCQLHLLCVAVKQGLIYARLLLDGFCDEIDYPHIGLS